MSRAQPPLWSSSYVLSQGMRCCTGGPIQTGLVQSGLSFTGRPSGWQTLQAGRDAAHATCAASASPKCCEPVMTHNVHERHGRHVLSLPTTLVLVTCAGTACDARSPPLRQLPRQQQDLLCGTSRVRKRWAIAPRNPLRARGWRACPLRSCVAVGQSSHCGTRDCPRGC